LIARLSISKFALLALLCGAMQTLVAAEKRTPLFHYDFNPDPATEAALIDLAKAWRADLDDTGIHPFLSYWGDFLANPVGGASPTASWMQLLVAGTRIDLEPTTGWTGGSLTVSVTDAAGSNLSNQVGNVFTISQAYVMNTFALYDVFLTQRLLEDRLEITLGRFSAGQFFATLPAMGQVVSGAVNGNPTSLFLNAPFQSTASASWAARTKFLPTRETYIEVGAFQATPRIGNPAYHGADFSIRRDNGLLIMAEMGWTPTFSLNSGRDLKGVYTLGGYYANNPTDTFSGGTTRNVFGFYALGQQMIWRQASHPNNNLSLWGGITLSPQDELAPMPVMAFGGLIWQGLIPNRENDSLLLSTYLGGFSTPYANAQAEAGNGRPTMETVFEISYLIQINKHLQIQPDLQWILQPGGTGDIPNALVIGFQVGVTF